MAKRQRKPKQDSCQDTTCPALSGSKSLPSCECDRNAELQAILSSTLEPVVTIDSFGTIRSVSNSIERVFGWRPDELVGHNVRVLMPEPHHSNHDGYLASHRKTLKTTIMGQTRELEAVRRDGERFPIELSVSRADVPGQADPIFVGIIKDVSERKAVERELEEHRTHLGALVEERSRALEATHEQLRIADRLAAIGTLAAGLGHDMNNVLLPVRARLNALDAMGLSDRASEHVEQIRASCSYLQQLTDGLHMLSLGSDEADGAESTTDLVEWWDTVGPLLSKAVPKGVRFNARVDAELPPVCVASHRLTQAVLNLIVNAGEAIQTMPRKAVQARVQLSAHLAPGGGAVHLSVADNGPGMSSEVLNRAFDAFFSTKRRGLGTGLGLSLVRNIALSAGGEVDVASSPGNGAEIVLTLPCATSHQRVGGDANRVAVVCLFDRRASSMAAHILESEGWVVNRSNEPSLPIAGASTILVTDSDRRGIRMAREFTKRADCVIVAVGPTPSRAAWENTRPIMVENPRDFDALREAIARAIASIRGSSK